MTIEIPLTQGQIAIVDDYDADLAQFKWHASFSPAYANGGKFVAARNIAPINGKYPRELMHRVILSRILGRPLLRSEHVDHKNLAPLCNVRSNLRLATRSQNQMNTDLHANNTSGYRGVSWDKSSKKWQSRIYINGKSRYLGHFNDPAEAYAAYCKAALEFHGEFANLG